MTWDTAIDLVHRFYGFSISEVDNMTMKEFTNKLTDIATITKMEMGDDGKKDTSVSGDAGFAMAKQLFPRGRSRHR